MHVTPLEPRRLFSVGVAASPYARLDDNGVLRIFGSNASESIDLSGFYGETVAATLQPSSWTVVVQPTDSADVFNPAYALLTFDVTDVSRVVVYGGGGDDVIDLSTGFRVSNGIEPVDYSTVSARSSRLRENFVLAEYVHRKLIIDGGAGNDYIRGGQKNDVLFGGDGDDTLSGGFGADQMTGGKGTDTVDYRGRSDALAIVLGVRPGSNRNGGLLNDGRNYEYNPEPENAAELPDVSRLGGTGGLENDRIRYDVENVLSGDGDDVILGNKSRNRIEGGGGNDFILGGAGYDTLFGGSGDDTFWSVDTRDGMPWIKINPEDPGRAEDKVYGGRGNDFARTDGWDTLDSIETEFELPYLYS